MLATAAQAAASRGIRPTAWHDRTVASAPFGGQPQRRRQHRRQWRQRLPLNVQAAGAGFGGRPPARNDLDDSAQAPAQRAPPLSAAAPAGGAGQPQPPQQPQAQLQAKRHPVQEEDPRVWAAVQQVAQQALELEGRGGGSEAVSLLTQGLVALEQQHGPALSINVLRQMVWDLHYAAGRHQAALQQARLVHAAVLQRFGEESGEVQLTAVHLGMSMAACGQLDEGLRLIYGATPVLSHNLQLMVDQVHQLAESDQEQDRMQAAALEPSLDKVAVVLGEGNLYGALFTLQRAVEHGRQAGVVQGWEDLEKIVVAGLGTLMAATGGSGSSSVAAALRSHDRLTEQLAGDAVLARLVAAQNQRLHLIVEQGLNHPIFSL